MDFTWNWAGGPLILAAPIFLSATLLVFLARPDREQNRFLAICFGGWFLYGSAGGAGLLVSDASTAYALHIVATIGTIIFNLGYVLFLGTLATPLAGWLKQRATRTISTALAAILCLSAIVTPHLWQAGVSSNTGAAPWTNTPGPMWIPFDLAAALLLVTALILATSAYRRATGPLARRQTGTYLLGFAVFDGTILVMLAIVLSGVIRGGLVTGPWFFWGVLAAAIWLTATLTYGILRTQLFGIELTLKWTLKRSTLVGVFVAAFFVSAQVAQAFLTTEYGWAIGGVVAGLLLLAINPLQRLSARIADTAMPRVQNTEEYRTVRKQEIYRTTLEEMLIDGKVTAKERRVLARLQEQLGLDAAAAQVLEIEVLEKREES